MSHVSEYSPDFSEPPSLGPGLNIKNKTFQQRSGHVYMYTYADKHRARATKTKKFSINATQLLNVLIIFKGLLKITSFA